MLEDAERRSELSIGNSLEEMEVLAAKIGYPVHIVPFGTDECIRVKSEGELRKEADKALTEGLWSLVHVLKPLGKYPDEF